MLCHRWLARAPSRGGTAGQGQQAPLFLSSARLCLVSAGGTGAREGEQGWAAQRSSGDGRVGGRPPTAKVAAQRRALPLAHPHAAEGRGREERMGVHGSSRVGWREFFLPNGLIGLLGYDGPYSCSPLDPPVRLGNQKKERGILIENSKKG